jgi:hypothetical protein
MKKPVVLGILFVLAVVAVMLYSTLNISRYRVEVCMQFDGRMNCAKAAAESKQAALQTAVQTACAPISGGVTDTIRCQNTQPATVNWLSGN